MNKYEKIIEYLANYSQTYGWIYLNVFPSVADNISVASVQNERVLEEYIDGSRRVEFLFAIELAKEYDIGTSDVNTEAIQEFESISEWIEAQNTEGIFPDFGESASVAYFIAAEQAAF